MGKNGENIKENQCCDYGMKFDFNMQDNRIRNTGTTSGFYALCPIASRNNVV